MLNLFNHFKEIFFNTLKEIAAKNNIEILASDFEKFIVEPAKEKSHGSLACNIAMTLSKKFSSIATLNNPKKLAEEIIKNVDNKSIAKLEIAGPGFINIFLHNDIFYKVLGELLEDGKLDFPNLGRGEKVNLEYASPNPTGPIHVGHCRGAIYGDVLAELLKKCGFDVLKEYYVNDAGSQIISLLKSAYIRYLKAIGVYKKDMPEGFYPGEYLEPIGKAIAEKFGGRKLFDEEFYKIDLRKPSQKIRSFEEIKGELESGAEIMDLVIKSYEFLESKEFLEYRDFVVGEMVSLIVSDLEALGIKHDSIFSEKKELHDTGKIKEIIEFLKTKTDKDGNPIIYEGKLEAPKTEKGVGALPEGYDEANQTLFRSTSFGDDQDRVIKKSDGTKTYFAADLAYLKSKFERGATKFIMPLGFDHAGYIKRLTAATQVITNGKAELKIILCQMVKFVKNGEPLKMSKRAGNFITARDVIDELNKEVGDNRGADVLRFIMLSRKNDTPFDFDLAKVIEQSKDNPIFYVQYAHTRCCSVLRNLKSEGLLSNIENEKIDVAILNNLQDESEIDIIKKIINFPRIIEMATLSYEPHRIAFYLQELAGSFHALWNKGVENPNLKFIIRDNLEVTKSRIYLLMAIKLIISEGLAIFNIKALEEMR